MSKLCGYKYWIQKKKTTSSSFEVFGNFPCKKTFTQNIIYYIKFTFKHFSFLHYVNKFPTNVR